MVWVGKDLKDHPVATALPWAGTPFTRPGCSKPRATWPSPSDRSLCWREVQESDLPLKCKERVHPGSGRAGLALPLSLLVPAIGSAQPSFTPSPCHGTTGAADPLCGAGRADWLVPSCFDLSGGSLWDPRCHQNLLCLPWHLPACASLQCIGQNLQQIPQLQRSSAPSMGPGQAGGSPRMITQCSPSI